MTTLFGFGALVWWFFAFCFAYDAVLGGGGNSLDVNSRYFVVSALVAAVFNGLWLAARGRERKNARIASGRA